MALDPELVPILAALEELGIPDPATVSPQELREAMVLPPAENPTPVANVEEISLPGPGGTVPVRLFHPGGELPLPVLVFFHGGGWVVGDLDSHDETCRQLCAGAGAIVVSVDYRLAPETPFPGGLEDCYAATLWVCANAAELGGDRSRVAVGGDSAGGNLAAAVCLLARERGGPDIRHQLLVYPVTDRDFSTRSYRDNAEGYFLTRGMMEWFWEHYLADDSQALDPLAAPLKGELSGLPAATVITAGYDPLRDEGVAYADKLAAAGVQVEQREFKEMIHGFVSLNVGLTQTGVAVDYLCQRLRDSFTG
jgi:acetyl esterase